jgi:RNA polymerase sigma-70 factor (ECF subfamily)
MNMNMKKNFLRFVQKDLVHDEEELIAGCASGSRKAQRLLYEKYAKKLYVVALRYSKTTFEAEDILQEAFIKVFEHITTFKRECPLEYWLRRIVVNTALKHNRRKLDQAQTEDVHEMYDEPSEEITLSNYNFRQLLQFIQRLAPRYQMVFNLYAIEGYKHHEIAEMLDITEGTSKSQYSRAKVLLQEMIEKDERYIYERLR